MVEYDDWKFPFGKYRRKTLAEIPSSYLDWLLGAEWFIKKEENEGWLNAIGEELATRRRSGYEPPED